MNKLVCEMCGASDFVKQNGVFVCQKCGMKYSPEEAKSLTGNKTVKIDTTEETNNFITLARRSFSGGDYVKAMEYFEQAMINDPQNPIPVFYVPYCKIEITRRTDMKTLSNACTAFTNALPTYFCLHNQKYSYEIARDSAENAYDICTILVDELLEDCYTYKKELEYEERYSYKDIWNFRYIPNAFGAIDILFTLGDCFEEYYSDDPAMREKILLLWKSAIDKTSKKILGNGYTKKDFRETISSKIPPYVEKIKNYEPTYEAPKTSGGCYVATAVYGSYNCPEVWTLRRYRDNTLAQTWYGRAFIKTYYAISPTLVKWFGKTEWFKKMWRGTLDKMVKNLQENGVESSPYEDRDW